jgi:dihydroxyacetone kinase
MGIHNENGVKRMSPVPPLDDLVGHLLDFLTSTTDPDRSYLPFRGDGTDRVILMVNNLGGVSELELNAVAHSATTQLRARRLTLVRILVGTFMVCLFLLHMSVSD